MMANKDRLAETLAEVFISLNVLGGDMKPANVVDALEDIALAIEKLADVMEKKNEG
jgi:hypothetical protein